MGHGDMMTWGNEDMRTEHRDMMTWGRDHMGTRVHGNIMTEDM